MTRILIVYLLFGVVFYACDQSQPTITEERVEPAGEQNQSPKEITDVVEHYKNGVVKVKGKSVDGKRVGLWESFFENGYKWSEVEYVNGVKKGPVVVYYQNGMMRYQGRYYNDERAGLWTFYDTTGIVLKKVDMDKASIETDSIPEL